MTGAVAPLDQVWRLARAWYAGRHDETWSPRTPAEAEQVFASVGLEGEFWSLR